MIRVTFHDGKSEDVKDANSFTSWGKGKLAIVKRSANSAAESYEILKVVDISTVAKVQPIDEKEN